MTEAKQASTVNQDATGKVGKPAGRREAKKHCPHGHKRQYYCKQCKGAGICKHNRQRPKCKECGGTTICEHGRQRPQCKECRGSCICPHNRVRSQCKDCGGSSICIHRRHRYMCKQCRGTSLCVHLLQKTRCKECKSKPARNSTSCSHGTPLGVPCKECPKPEARTITCPHGYYRVSLCQDCTNVKGNVKTVRGVKRRADSPSAAPATKRTISPVCEPKVFVGGRLPMLRAPKGISQPLPYVLPDNYSNISASPLHAFNLQAPGAQHGSFSGASYIPSTPFSPSAAVSSKLAFPAVPGSQGYIQPPGLLDYNTISPQGAATYAMHPPPVTYVHNPQNSYAPTAQVHTQMKDATIASKVAPAYMSSMAASQFGSPLPSRIAPQFGNGLPPYQHAAYMAPSSVPTQYTYVAPPYLPTA